MNDIFDELYHPTIGMENFRKWNLPVKVTQTVYSGM